MTFTSKIERIYFGAKGVLFAPLLAWVYIHGGDDDIISFTYLLIVFGLINMLVLWMASKRWLKDSGVYFPLTAVDVLFVFTSMVHFDAARNMFIIYYFLIGLLSLFRPLANLVIAGILFTAAYLLASLVAPYGQSIGVMILRVSYIWLIGGIGSVVARFILSSEKKLLSTLDMLNERTWELESSQSMLENMYETTRALASILHLEQLLDEVLNVARDQLRIKNCTILLVESSGKNLCIFAELETRKKKIFNPPKIIAGRKPTDIATHMAASYSERLFVGQDISKRVLELPLISHGKVLGILQIESESKRELSEKDRKNFTILANAAAIALDNAILHMKMKELTVIDELTGLFNYRYFQIKLTDEIRRADRYHQPLSMLMIDVDHFKKINDSQGHQTGNIILQEIVSIIKNSVRDVDIVARYGGEEFVVLLPQTATRNAMNIAERMRRNVEKALFTNSQGQRDIKTTISIGIAVYPEGIVSADHLLERVDQAMYLAKNKGRNRVCTAPKTAKEAVKKK